MTDKTELLPCPFCGKEAKLDVAPVRDDNAWCFIRCSYGCKAAPHVGDHACIWYWSEGKKYRHQSDEKAIRQATDRATAAWNTRAAPPQDVRAVVDEPVAWLVNGVAFTNVKSAREFMGFSNFEVIPLYRHPQRPMVLPERVDPDFFDSVRATGIGWNACMDMIAELNK